jgi:hypothetical protein
VFNSRPKEEIMLMRYNDGEKTILMTINQPDFDINEVDFITDVNVWDLSVALYMKDGQTIFLADVVEITPCEDEPELVEIEL